MNFVDYLFNNSVESTSDLFLLGKEELSYKELKVRVSSLSYYLKKNFGEQNNILLCSHSNIFFIVSYLSIIQSGNVCIPIDPSLSTQNLDYLLNETNPKLIFNSAFSRMDNSLFSQYAVLNEERITKIISGKREYVVQQSFDHNRVAEIIFTSGSTGKPKGVMLSHLNLISNTDSIISYLHLSCSDRALVVLPFYYCYGLSLLHTHLKCKGSIVINSSFMFLGGVINDLLKYQCTGFAGVPSHYQILLRKTKLFVSAKFPSLRYVTQAGGKLHNVFIEEFISFFNNIAFYVMYGQTEATARLSYLPPNMLKEKIGSIGKGIPGVSLKVVNPDFTEVRPGESGEIVAKGNNIMLGYYNDKVLSDETIVNGWLKTGDIATIDNEGYIYILARSKEIIKIRGKRVSPKEIEEIILTMDEVIDCYISAYDDELEGEAIEAQVLLADEFKGKISEKDILNYCANLLELYKIPSRVVLVDKMNLSSSGKKLKS